MPPISARRRRRQHVPRTGTRRHAAGHGELADRGRTSVQGQARPRRRSIRRVSATIRSHRCPARQARRERSSPRGRPRLSFELARNSSLRGRPLAGNGKLALSPGSVRDAQVELSAGANQRDARPAVSAAPATRWRSRWTRAIPPRSTRGSAAVCTRPGGLPAHGSGRRSRSMPPADALRAGTAFAAATFTARRRESAPAQTTRSIVRCGLSWRRPGCAPTPSPRAACARMIDGTLAHHQAKIAIAGSAAMPPISTSSRQPARRRLVGRCRRPARGPGTSSRCESRGQVSAGARATGRARSRRRGGSMSRACAARSPAAASPSTRLRWQDGRLSSRGEFAALPAAPMLALTGAATRVSSTLDAGRTMVVRRGASHHGHAVGVARRRRPGARSMRPNWRSGSRAPSWLPNSSTTACTRRSSRARAWPTPTSSPTSRRRRSPAAASAPVRRSRLSARLDAASLRALQGLAGTTAIVDGRLKLDLAGAWNAGQRALFGHHRRRCAQARSGAVRRRAEGRTPARAPFRRSRSPSANFRSLRAKAVSSPAARCRRRATSEGARLAWKADKLALFNRPDTRLTLSGAGTLSFQRGSVTLAGALKADEGYFEFRPSGTDVPGDDVIVRGRETKPVARYRAARSVRRRSRSRFWPAAEVRRRRLRDRPRRQAAREDHRRRTSWSPTVRSTSSAVRTRRSDSG